MIDDPLFYPTNRVRKQCLLLLTALVAALLWLASGSGLAVVIRDLPWEKAVHALGYGVLAGVAWVVLGGRSPWGTIVVAGSIALLEEGMKLNGPGGVTEVLDLVADLAGAALVVLALKTLRDAKARQDVDSRRPGRRAG